MKSEKNNITPTHIKSFSSDISENELEENNQNKINSRIMEIPKVNTYLNLNLHDINNSFCKTSRSSKTDFHQVKNTIHLRINFIININYFIKNYVYDINQIFNKIDSIIYRKITNLIEKSKYYNKFFKEITSNLDKFCFSLDESVNSLNFHFREDKQNFTKVNYIIEKTQNNFTNKINELNKNLQEKLILKGPLSEIKNFHSKISEISKDSYNILNEINKKKDKFCGKYSSHEKLFENFKMNYNSYDKILNLLQKNDFYLIEIELCKVVNKLFTLVDGFFLKYIYCLGELKNICKEFISSVIESIEIYKKEINCLFIINALDTFNIESEDLINNLINSKEIFYDQNDSKDLENLLKIFQNNIIKFNFIKNDQIYYDENFKVNRFKSYEEIVDFFLSIIPEKIKYESSNLSVFNMKFNRTIGYYKEEKESIFVISLQDNILIFSEKLGKKNYEKLYLKNVKFMKIDDKCNPFKFEISEVKLGVLYNSVNRFIFDTKNVWEYLEIKEFFANNKINSIDL